MKTEEASTSTASQKLTWQRIAPLLLFVVMLFTFCVLTKGIFSHNERNFDESAFRFFESMATPGITKAFTRLTFFGSSAFLFPAYFMLVLYFLIKGKTQWSLSVATVALSSAGLLFCIKRVFQRQRPSHPLISNVEGFSYPSGHSFSSFIFAGITIYILWQSRLHTAWKWLGTLLLFLFACSIAISRIYLHVHYSSDVLAGFCLSILWLCISIYFLQKLARKKLSDLFAI